MSFFQPRFCGVTVRDFKTSLRWGGESSSLMVTMVQDNAAGDTPNPPPVGWPCYFQFYGLRFSGLLQKWEQTNSTDGLPTFEAVLHDPREILEGAQLILGDYSGSVSGVTNLLNVYGYWESQGFGSSDANKGGMPWHKVRDALLALCNRPSFGPYGGPLNYRGIAYSLDLSELPEPPAFYRLSGQDISLLQAIQQLCDDAAVDFFVELSGYTIKIRTVNRNQQTPAGAISNFVTLRV